MINHDVDSSFFNEVISHLQILERKGQDQNSYNLSFAFLFPTVFFLENFLCLRLNLGSTYGSQAWGKNIMNSRGSMVTDPIKLFERKLAKVLGSSFQKENKLFVGYIFCGRRDGCVVICEGVLELRKKW